MKIDGFRTMINDTDGPNSGCFLALAENTSKLHDNSEHDLLKNKLVKLNFTNILF